MSREKLKSRILLTLELDAGTEYISSEYQYIDSTVYNSRLLNHVDVHKRLTGGRLYPSSLTLELDDADGHFATLFSGGEEFRGDSVKITHYEPEKTTQETIYLYAIIDSASFAGSKFIIDCTVQDHEPLQTTLPRKSLDEDSPSNWTSYPTVNGTTIRIPPYDQGKSIALIFGNAAKVPCRYALYDADNDYWEYLIGPTVLVDSVSAVYRDKVVVDSSEYSFHTDSRYEDEDGITYAYLRFTQEQLDFSGNPYQIEADVSSPSDYRNFIYVIQKILSETWGCNTTVNATTFTSVKANWTSYYCDGAVYEETKVQDLIDQLLECCPRTYIYYDENGWNIADDSSYNSTAEANFGSGDGIYENIIDYSYKAAPSKSNVIKKLKVKYQYNPWESEYPVKIERTVNSFGEDETLKLPFVRDGETADRISSRIQNLEQYAGERLNLTVGSEGRLLNKYDPIDVTIKWKHRQDTVSLISGLWQVITITHGLTRHELECRSYGSSIYTYNAGTIPSSPEDDGRTDYSNTNPDAPTSFTLDSSGTHQGTDGGTKAYFEFSADAPTTNFSKMVFGYRKSDATIYTWTDGDEPSSGNTWTARFDGLSPGANYDFIAMSVNAFNVASLSNPTLSSQTAPGDSSAPAAPTGLSATGKIGAIEIKWTANSEGDFARYKLYRSTDGSVYSLIAKPDTNQYTDPNTNYTSTYYYKVYAVDYSGNTSSASSVDTASPKKSDLDNDIDDGTTYARTKSTYLSDGQTKISGLLDDGEQTLQISSTNIEIAASGGLTISASGGLKVTSGGGLEVSAASGITVTDGSSIELEDGGDIVIGSQGGIKTYGYAYDYEISFYGNVVSVASDTSLYLLADGNIYVQPGADILPNSLSLTFDIGSSATKIGHIYTEGLNVGPSTSSNSDTINVCGSGEQNVRIESTNNSAAVILDNSSYSWYFYSPTGSSDLKMYYTNDTVDRFRLTKDGDLYIEGTLYENDNASVDTQKISQWDLFWSIHDMYKKHDYDLLHPELKYFKYDEDDLGPTGKYTRHKSITDFVQILAECLGDITKRTEKLENEQNIQIQ
jgi:hypothetical protein